MVTRILALAGEANGSVSATVKRKARTQAARRKPHQEPRGVWREDILPKNIAIPERVPTPSIKSLSLHFGSIETSFCKTSFCKTPFKTAAYNGACLHTQPCFACAVSRNGERIMAALFLPP